jgi:hypothetical protein
MPESVNRRSRYSCTGHSRRAGGLTQLLTSPKGKSWFRLMPAWEVSVPTASDRSEPSLAEVLLMLGMVFVVDLLTVCRVESFWDVAAS